MPLLFCVKQNITVYYNSSADSTLEKVEAAKLFDEFALLSRLVSVRLNYFRSKEMPDASSPAFTNVSPTTNKKSQISSDIPSNRSNCSTSSTLSTNENNSPEKTANVSDGNEHLPSYSHRPPTPEEKLTESLIPNGNKEEETQSTDRNSENERSPIEEKTKEEVFENSTQVEETDSVFIDNLKADLYEVRVCFAHSVFTFVN